MVATRSLDAELEADFSDQCDFALMLRLTNLCELAEIVSPKSYLVQTDDNPLQIGTVTHPVHPKSDLSYGRDCKEPVLQLLAGQIHYQMRQDSQ
jgi:hypothetical protein